MRLTLVGGFLGSGKTTLLWQAARELVARGMRVGLVTNDQAPGLVDTKLLEVRGFGAEEVTGSCFCCNFLGLIQAARKVGARLEADVVLAEPVGSCADLSATLLQPLKAAYNLEFTLSPFSVLADPVRLRELLTGTDRASHPNAAYIVRKQLEEADVIVVNKLDEVDARARKEIQELVEDQLPGHELRWLSALQGTGVSEWLDAMLAGGEAGRRVVEMDYDRYADGEAIFGWLNAVVELTSGEDRADWPGFCRRLLHALQQACRERAADVGHVKLMLSGPGGYCVGNLTRTDGRISVQDSWEPRGDPPGQAALTLNARVVMDPAQLERVVRDAFAVACGDAVRADFLTLATLSPGRPAPTYRYGNVVP